jgi:hypothetical protein
MGSKINKNLIELKLKKIFPDYSFDMSNYTNTHSKIPVTCPKHGTSNQLVKNLLKGHGYNKCGNEKSASKQRLDFNEIISNQIKNIINIINESIIIKKFNHFKL